MVEMIKQMTGTQIVVGQNGVVWMRGDNEDVAAEAVLAIEERAHMHGLTDYIKTMLEKHMGKPYVPKPPETREEGFRDMREPREERGERFERREQEQTEQPQAEEGLGDVENIQI
jgi:exosome complex component RRP4